ncbi:capsule polysaccharide export protein KpsE/RkpR [Streptacidiphilus sp. MAP12-16]
MASPKKDPDQRWRDPSTMYGAVLAALLGSLIFWGITTLTQHLTIHWH